MSSLGKEIGERIRAHRRALAWSQARLAEAVGITPNYVGLLERGEKLPTLETLVAVAAALGTSASALLDGEQLARDGWQDDVAALAAAAPVASRPAVLAILRALVASAPSPNPGPRARRRRANPQR